ncbi:cysteine desulfurase family protein [Cellulomonas marina]|uniref:Cysteine desulfurase n=1 Tax=Cellulomonas marina TaxID=988821 RepID=A0A1I0W0K4_9CELL|nr:aminotransferase class V-fold PLP-dependent enzyme [Cellulomonas marina]GIG27431.1 aminotransferase [Cellulomonas marina]SFA81968.1 cysteine desulfurase [Cellulomonas marina]
MPPSAPVATPRVVLDAAGHAPPSPRVRDALLAALDEGWGDPRRLHAEGRRARALLDGARESLAAGLGARTEEIALAPSHTQALHAAVLTVARGRRRVGADVVVPAVERAAVLHAADAAGTRRTVPVDRLGRVDADAFAAAAGAPGVALAALQVANGEVGTRQPVDAAASAARAAGVPLLVDAGAAAGHVALPDGWDLLTADAGDWGAPAPLGVLAVRAGVRRAPVGPSDEDAPLTGGFPGGVVVPVALAAAVALEERLAARDADDAARRALVARLRARVAAEVPDVEVVGDPQDRLPHVLTFSCLYVDGEALVGRLDAAGFAVGSGSACSSSTLEPSHVLTAMGVLTHGNVRLALPPGTATADVERFADVLPGLVREVRGSLGASHL